MDEHPIRASDDGLTAYLELDGRYLARYRRATGEIVAWIPEDLLENGWLVEHLVLLPVVFEALRDRGYIALHAAALAHERRVVLLPGGSGSGKSTLALALLRGGFTLLSDDSPLLHRVGRSIEVASFAERVNVSHTTAQFFPELLASWEAGKPDPRGKVPINMARVYANCIARSGTPQVLIFPTVGDERSHIEPLNKTEALFRLLPQLVHSLSIASAHDDFALASDLLRTTSCYTMRTGRDFDDIPRIIAGLFDEKTPPGGVMES